MWVWGGAGTRVNCVSSAPTRCCPKAPAGGGQQLDRDPSRHLCRCWLWWITPCRDVPQLCPAPSLPTQQTNLAELPAYLGVGDRGERRFTDSFICPINHFNGLSAITIFPRVGRAGVPTISGIEKPWMAIIINAHNKNMPGSRTPRAPLHPLVYGPAAPAPGQPRGGQEQQFTWQRGSTKERLSKTTIF